MATFVVLLLLTGAGIATARATPGPTISYGSETINIKSQFTVEEATKTIVEYSKSTPQDPNQYSYALQCQLDENAVRNHCLPGQITCPPSEDGTEGQAIIWRYAPKSIPNPTWTEWTQFGAPTCLYDPKPEDILPRIAARILQDFQQLPVVAGTVSAQPSPHTLVGAETNVFANATEQQFEVTILGQKVHLTATPAQYTFNYGDGSTLGPSATYGGPIPEAEWGVKTRTSHVYGDTGDFNVTVTTSFTGTYSVNNGPALPISGTGEFTSAPETLRVWRSVTRNYADDCNVNPLGEGCPAR
ncbi:hypothetical protein V1639_01010 [Pseudarthrobacter sp. J75]|uniref:PKD domain-containing protein n=1 Tax=unclassified Pseudarthrobacter TaxID=2647000 RepID=UPI002E8169FD|nr:MULTISPECIES: hypothetical protein [unclassified Pseudarthrobacter]MEE2524564.1 hypothetical protein [Pseudarthrobacter sp. J47]MEE2527607.1 hypothetical protein [Pseudarthrobacter sp. J75]